MVLEYSQHSSHFLPNGIFFSASVNEIYKYWQYKRIRNISLGVQVHFPSASSNTILYPSTVVKAVLNKPTLLLMRSTTFTYSKAPYSPNSLLISGLSQNNSLWYISMSTLGMVITFSFDVSLIFCFLWHTNCSSSLILSDRFITLLSSSFNSEKSEIMLSRPDSNPELIGQGRALGAAKKYALNRHDLPLIL